MLKRLNINLGYNCNKSCSYCRENSVAVGDCRLGIENNTLFFNNLYEIVKNNPLVSVSFIGGEPFLYKSKMIKCIELLREHLPEIEVFIITNGILLDEKMVKKYNAKICLSYDREHKESLRLLNKSYISKIFYVLSKNTYDEALEILKSKPKYLKRFEFLQYIGDEKDDITTEQYEIFLRECGLKTFLNLLQPQISMCEDADYQRVSLFSNGEIRKCMLWYIDYEELKKRDLGCDSCELKDYCVPCKLHTNCDKRKVWFKYMILLGAELEKIENINQSDEYILNTIKSYLTVKIRSI